MKALVLLSGGLDSCVCLAHAIKEYGADNIVTAALRYGQLHIREVEASQKIASYYGVKHIEKDITAAMDHVKSVCSLVQGSEIEMSNKSYAEQIAESGKPNTEVPLRNGLFLMIAGSLAMSLFPDEEVSVIYGAHSDDAAGNAYPDCSPEFAAGMDEVIRIGSRDKVHVERPLVHLTKAEVVSLGLQLGAPFEMTTSCYHGGEYACSVCGTCIDRINAFRANGVIDPIKYAVGVDWTGCKDIKEFEK